MRRAQQLGHVQGQHTSQNASLAQMIGGTTSDAHPIQIDRIDTSVCTFIERLLSGFKVDRLDFPPAEGMEVVRTGHLENLAFGSVHCGPDSRTIAAADGVTIQVNNIKVQLRAQYFIRLLHAVDDSGTLDGSLQGPPPQGGSMSLKIPLQEGRGHCIFDESLDLVVKDASSTSGTWVGSGINLLGLNRLLGFNVLNLKKEILRKTFKALCNFLLSEPSESMPAERS